MTMRRYTVERISSDSNVFVIRFTEDKDPAYGFVEHPDLPHRLKRNLVSVPVDVEYELDAKYPQYLFEYSRPTRIAIWKHYADALHVAKQLAILEA